MTLKNYNKSSFFIPREPCPLNLITSALGWKTIFRKQMFNNIFWVGSINVFFGVKQLSHWCVHSGVLWQMGGWASKQKKTLHEST